MSVPFVIGAVAYDPKVVTIWEGFRALFRERGLDNDVVLFTNYERQVEALLAGDLDTAWNSPLAWVRARRLAAAAGQTAHSLVMRDSDQDLTSLILVRTTDAITSLPQLRGATIATGAIDSPQATLLPLGHLRQAGLITGQDVYVRRFDLLVGKHGDHIGGEREAVRALLRGDVAAACILDANHAAFIADGTMPSGATRILARTAPYDHCNFTAIARAGGELAPEFANFRRVLLDMSFADPVVRPLFDLEGLKAWRPGRTLGYQALEQAVDDQGFYHHSGAISASGYHP